MIYRDGDGDYWFVRQVLANGKAKVYACDEKGNSLGSTLFTKNLSLMQKIS